MSEMAITYFMMALGEGENRTPPQGSDSGIRHGQPIEVLPYGPNRRIG